jgi:hypothetical protein
VRSCGLVRNWDNTGKRVEHFEVLGACVIGASPRFITAENSTASGNEYMEATTACQEKPTFHRI